MLDTGPLIALLNHRDRYHDWAKQQWNLIRPPLLTCEAVITEACFLLRQTPQGRQAVLNMMARQILNISFQLEREAKAVEQLVQRYRSVPMSLADACLVRMLEIHPGSSILTLDSDFLIYRIHKNQPISAIAPFS